MRCDYHDTPGNSGLLQYERVQLRTYILEAHRCGWQVATHAIGDATLDVVLDAYEEAQRRYPRAEVRHRVEHAAVASDEQVSRTPGWAACPFPRAASCPRSATGCSRRSAPNAPGWRTGCGRSATRVSSCPVPRTPPWWPVRRC
ncbi:MULTISPECIES: amidohydrolase family protein [unclassified Streptomyces]|uniref:amidohydrolase family protein n=1 Tax=unclassified Streptomyces TaxID=2593676 RepID=UPI0003A8B459|nr:MULTISPECIES: amidohydrolase family protein [unclassified Streptomyces]